MRMRTAAPAAPVSGLMRPPAHGAEPFLLFVLGAMVFSSAFVIVDIAYSALAMAALGLFVLLGLRIDRANLPLIGFLVIYNLGGLIALQPYLDVPQSREFMIGTAFVATTAIFFAMALNENALARLAAIRRALILGAGVASAAGILGYLRVAGLDAYFLMHGSRVSATFRDPNVFGPFLVLPALYLIGATLTGHPGLFRRMVFLGPILLALLLTFSRGAWAGMVIGTIVLIVLIKITSVDPRARLRVALLTLLGFLGAGLALAALLSIDGVADLLADRFVLQKDYDSGPEGRFGSQLRSIPDLLDRPFGHGPNRFSYFYPENPHNTYIMAFSSYGWLGGVAFLAFIACTLAVGFRAALQRTPFQLHAIVIFAALIPHLVQNFQIDTDRWRHLFLIYGLTWGIAAVSSRWILEQRAQRPRPPAATPYPAEARASSPA